MGKEIIYSVFLLSFFSCIQHGNELNEVEYFEKSDNTFEVKYAKGFSFEQEENFFKIITKSHSGNSDFKDVVYGFYNDEVKISKDFKVLNNKVVSLCCQSSTHLSFLDYLGFLDKVTGLCGVEYVQNKHFKTALETNGTKELCVGEKTQLEELISQNPDIYFVYPFAAEEIEKLEDRGIKTLMIAEYLEEDPLARLEWIKVFGVMFGEYEKANNYFENTVDVYNSYKEPPLTDDNQFILNLPFGDTWDAPSSNSLLVQLCNDAGLQYYFNGEKGTENEIHSKEKMWVVGAEVPYWIIIANREEDFTLADLIAEDEVYSTFRSVKEGKVIFCNTSTSDYFTYGIIQPDNMLYELSLAIQGKDKEDAQFFKLLR
jgi:cobalamin transport system substrate-binding protein